MDEFTVSLNDVSFVGACDDYGIINDGARSSDESSEGFNFLAASNPRKNLTSKFEEEVVPKPSMASVTSTARSSSSVATTASSQSVFQTIAQFEAKTSQATRPPLPLRQQSNVVPSNQLATYLRIRPPSETNSTSVVNSNSTIEVLKPKHPKIHPTTVRTYPPLQSNVRKVHSHRQAEELHAKQFEFHQVLPPETSQQTVYTMVATPLFQGIFDATFQSTIKNYTNPQSALLFSYGITNAGKTHTILGDLRTNNPDNWGIIPRAISDIFHRINQIPKTAAEVDLYLSFFEVYNEQVYDLVPKKSETKLMGLPPPTLKVGERHGQTIVRGLAKYKINNIQHGIDLTIAANARRHTSSNNLNSDSSRSHCVCQMQLLPRPANHGILKQAHDDESVVSATGYSTDEEVNQLAHKRISTIWIVDLAGSERSKRTQMISSRQKEASQINKSLMTLMRCLTIMREGSRSSNIVPFRESKLTHVFMGHLTGSSASRTAMIVNVNPAVSDFDETQHVLGYAASARLIQIEPQELKQKRKQYFGDEYGMDGHKKKQSVFAKVVQGLKKLSPKKRPITNCDKIKQPVMPPNKPLEITSILDPIQVQNEPAPKRRRGGTTETSSSSPSPVSTSMESELYAVREALAKARQDITRLQSEKEDLLEELVNQESVIRMEVSEEMEQRLRVARERHRQEVERLRALLQTHEQPLESMRKARLDHVHKHIEELMDKVDECEGEISRMRQEHEQETEKLKLQHEVEIAKLKVQLEVKSTGSSERVIDLEQELQASRGQIERLKKTKIELVENYEKLLEDVKSKTLNESPESDDEQEDVENNVPLWKQKLTRGLKTRKILGSMSSNTGTVS